MFQAWVLEFSIVVRVGSRGHLSNFGYLFAACLVNGSRSPRYVVSGVVMIVRGVMCVLEGFCLGLGGLRFDSPGIWYHVLREVFC